MNVDIEDCRTQATDGIFTLRMLCLSIELNSTLMASSATGPKTFTS